MKEKPDCKIPAVRINSPLPFQDGDVISINPDGSCSVVWEKNSCHNAFYVTDLCNSKCIMCPQIDGRQSRYDECLKILGCIDLRNDKNIGITGGEPTIEPEKLLKLLSKIAKKSPNQKVHILTNGRNFEDINLVKNLSKIEHLDISYGIPLYSDLAEEHDFITGVKGSFQQTIKGLYNLAQYKQKIEIRIVILKQNYRKLKDIAEYIYRNLPFVTHIALMGMEYHGRAETNYEDINIDPYDYKEELYEAIRQFVRYNITADVYNIPLCLADNRIEEFCRDSISSWKKLFWINAVTAGNGSFVPVFSKPHLHRANISILFYKFIEEYAERLQML